MTMKKKVLCVFSLILYILIACTLLAEKIEVEMMTQAEVWVVKASNSSFELKLSTGYLFDEDNGKHLFEIKEGTGWESGMRAEEISSQYWQIDHSSEVPMVKLNSFNDYTFIRTASRVPETGELVEIIEKPESAPDTWLVCYPEGIPEYEKLPTGMELIAQSENALLLSVEQSKYPFFEHRAIGDDLKQMEGSGMRVFSLSTVEAFLEQLLFLAVVLVLLLVPVVLWACSCFLSINPDRNKWLLGCNILLVAAALYFLRSVLGAIDLPAAMLPDDNILNWGHYSDEFRMLFENLKGMGVEAERMIALRGGAVSQALGILGRGGLCAAGGLVLEGLLGFLYRHAEP